MEIYQFHNMALPPIYVLIWFPIVHHYLCQSQVRMYYILHQHEKDMLLCIFCGFLGKGIEVNS